MDINELSPYARTLRCVADGNVMPIAELSLRSNSMCRVSDGYAVMAGGGWQELIDRFIPREEIEVVSPADGVVISVENGLTLRTGDGVSVSVFAGNAVQYLPEVGDKLRIGDVICALPKSYLPENGLNGAIAVLFSNSQQITELHISSGRKKAGERTAFYKVVR